MNNYFLIPGNPPAVHFYEQWALEIKSLKPEANAAVSPYRFLSKENDSHQAMETLSEAHLEELIKFYESTRSPVTIIGHSLGGYFALKLLEERPSLIKRVVLVHPFLRKPGREGQGILKIAAQISDYPALQNFIISKRKNLHPLIPPLRHVTDEELLNAAEIAKHEHRTIGQDQSTCKIPEEHREKITLFHNKKDWWSNSKVIGDLKNTINIQECSEPHNFVIKSHHRLSLLKKIFISP